MTHSFPTRRSSDLQTDIFQGQSMSHAFAYAYATAADDVAIGWNQTGGSATGSIVANALFEEGAAGPDPLSVSVGADQAVYVGQTARSEEHTSELQSLMRISYAVFGLKKKKR